MRIAGRTGVCFALAACATADIVTSQSYSAETPGAEGITLRFHTRSTPQENALYERQMARFTEQYPTLTLSQEAYGDEEFPDLVPALQASGEIGDVLWSSTVQDQLWHAWQQQIIQPLDELVADKGINLQQWYPQAVASIRWEGQLLGLPFKAHPGVALVYVNQRTFAAAGVESPQPDWTQAEQIELAQRLTQPSRETYGYWPALEDPWQALTTLLPTFGGRLLHEDGRTFQLASRAGLAALRYLADLFQKYRVTPIPGPLLDSGSDLWVSGKLAMLQSTTRLSALAVVVDEHFPWLVVPNALGPAGVGGASCVVDTQCITYATQHPQEALAWVEFLCNQESGVQLGLLGGTSGARPDVYGAPELLRLSYRRVFQQVMEQATAGPMTANGNQASAEQTLQQLLAPLWQGVQQPTEAFISAVATQVQAVLDQPLST